MLEVGILKTEALASCLVPLLGPALSLPKG